MSVHSSDKDKETVPPPLVNQNSGLSVEQIALTAKTTSMSEVWYEGAIIVSFLRLCQILLFSIYSLLQTWQFSKWLVQWFPVWQGLVVTINVAHWQIHLPTVSLAKPETVTPVDRVCIRLPVVQICSASPAHRHSQLLLPASTKLPVHLPSTLWVEGE